MAIDSSKPVELKICAAGQNWVRIGEVISLGMTGYYNRLPEGSWSSVHSTHPGIAQMQAPMLVGNGEFHLGITTPAWYAHSAMAGKTRTSYDTTAELRALCNFPHDDRFFMLVRADTGVTSIRELIDEKYPIRVAASPKGDRHCGGWALKHVLAAYGVTVEDIERWGGKVWSRDASEGGPPNFARADFLKRGEIHGVFDEAVEQAGDLLEAAECRFLPIPEEVISQLEEKLGAHRAVIERGRFAGGPQEDVPTISMEGWLLFCRADFPDEWAYKVLDAIDTGLGMLKSLFRPTAEIQHTDLHETWKDTVIPLHPGAQAYYRDKGYMA